jgi:ABC-type amino acid transport substrate-binding protein
LADNGDIHGFDVDIAKKVAEKWQAQADFVQVTRQTRIPMLESGKVDILAGSMPHRRDLSQFMEFTDATFSGGIGVLVSSDSGIKSPSDLSGKNIALVGNDTETAWNQFASKSGISANAQVFADVGGAMLAFSQTSGPIAIIGRSEDLMSAAGSVSNSMVLNGLILSEPYAYAVRRGDTPLRDLLNLTLQDLVKSGQYARVYSDNLFGNAPADRSAIQGDPVYSMQDFPSSVGSPGSIVAKIKRGEALRVAGFAGGSPSGTFDGQAIVDGYNRAVANELARRWNVPLQEVGQSVGGAGINLLKSGQADIVVGVRPDISLIGQVGLSQGYYQRGLRLIHLQGVSLLGIDDLQFKQVTILEPLDISQDLVVKNNQYAHITQASSNDDAFKSLTGGAAYAVVGDEYTLMLMARADTRIAVINQRYRLSDFVMALPIVDPDYINLVDFTLQDMKQDGTLDRLAAQYFSPYAPPDSPPPPTQIDIWPGDASYLGVGGY